MQNIGLQVFELQPRRNSTTCTHALSPQTTSSRFTRGLVWLVMLVALLSNVCLRGQDVFDNFCKEAVKAMKYNHELFSKASAGFCLSGSQIFNPTVLSHYKEMKTVMMLEELSSFQKLPTEAKDAIRGGLDAYDTMVDDWAHLYWDVGRRVSQKDFQQTKNLMWSVMTFWENQPGYSKIYAQMRQARLDADKVMRELDKDLTEVRDNSHEYSPDVLPSSNKLGNRLKEDPKKWPLKREDLKYWNIPKVYGVTWLEPNFQVNETFNRDTIMLNEYADMVANLAKGVKMIGIAYSEWLELNNKAVKLAPKVAKLSDSRFAQDNLTADFRETMEEAAEKLLSDFDWVKAQINGDGFKEYDKVMNFLESEAGKELAGKSGPLYKGTNGSTKEISRTFQLVAKQMADLYDRIAARPIPSTIEDFCKASEKAIRENNEMLKESLFRFNLDGTRVLYRADAFKATKNLKWLGSTNEYHNLPQKSRDAVKEIVNSYDHMMVGFADFYLQVAEDVKNDKFVAAKLNLGAVYSWLDSVPGYKEKYRKMLEERKNLDQAMQKFKKDMEDIKRHINDPNPNKLSPDNLLGQAVKKDPKRWPVRDSDLSHWSLSLMYRLYAIDYNCNITSTDRQKFKEFDDFAERLRNAPVYQETMKRVFTRWNEKCKLLGTYGTPVANAAKSSFAKQYLTPTLIDQLEEASKLPDQHVRKIQEQLNGKRGFKLVEDTNKVLSDDNARDVINRKGLLYRGISMTRSITETYNELARDVKQRYQDAAK